MAQNSNLASASCPRRGRWRSSELGDRRQPSRRLRASYDLVADYPFREANGLRPALVVAAAHAAGEEGVCATVECVERRLDEDTSQCVRNNPSRRAVYGENLMAGVTSAGHIEERYGRPRPEQR